MDNEKMEKLKTYSMVVIALSMAVIAYQISMHIADITNALNNISANGGL